MGPRWLAACGEALRPAASLGLSLLLVKVPTSTEHLPETRLALQMLTQMLPETFPNRFPHPLLRMQKQARRGPEVCPDFTASEVLTGSWDKN